MGGKVLGYHDIEMRHSFFVAHERKWRNVLRMSRYELHSTKGWRKVFSKKYITTIGNVRDAATGIHVRHSYDGLRKSKASERLQVRP